jgi:hypothetical protein
MKVKIILAAVVLILPGVAAYSSGLSSAKAVAMGGAHMGLAKGTQSALYNPANLGLPDFRQNGIELAGIGAEITNNSFTLADYNKYTGAVLTEDDKSVILGKIPSEGLKISAEAEAGALTASYGSFVLSINGYAATETNIGKDALDLFLNGNQLNDSFSIDGMYSDAVAYASVGLSYGRPIIELYGRELAVGATVKYIRGLAFEEITEIHGGVVTLTTGFSGEGTMIAHTAEGGSGLGLDLGAAYKFNDNYMVGLCFDNFISNINWSKATEQHSYHFEFDTLTVSDFDSDSIVVTEQQSIDIPAFSSTLPTVMRVGFANYSGKLTWGVDYIQGFKLAAGSSSKPELAMGAQYKILNFLPLRAGYSVGGGHGSTLSGGFGLEFPVFYLDIAFSNRGFLKFKETKGLHMALSLGLRF